MNERDLRCGAPRKRLPSFSWLYRVTLLAAIALVVGCGGGGSGGSSGSGSAATSTTSATPTGLTGSWYYNGAGTGVRFDLVSRDEVELALNTNSRQTIGYGAGMFTDFDEQVFISAKPNEYTINLRNVAPNPFSRKSSLATFPLANGFVKGPIQPSPNGALFAMQTRESAGLGSPSLDYVYVFDAALNITFKQVGYRAPAWLANNLLVAAAADGLYTITVAAVPISTRLGQAGDAPDQPSVSLDGRSVAFMKGDSVWRIGADGSGATQLTVAKATAQWPTWSPDGSRIVLVRGVCGQFTGVDILVISATSTNQNLADATTVLRKNGAPARSCGPVYWLP